MPKKQSKKTSNNQNKKITNHPLAKHLIPQYPKSQKTITPTDLARLDFKLPKPIDFKKLKESGNLYSISIHFYF